MKHRATTWGSTVWSNATRGLGSVSGEARDKRVDVPSETYGLLRACVREKYGRRYILAEDMQRILGAPGSKVRREVSRRLRLERRWMDWPVATHVFIVPAAELT